MIRKLILFDCDETLWTSTDRDYISSVRSPLKKLAANKVVRVKDKKVFTLKKGVLSTLVDLHKDNNQIALGIVSDNDPEEVISALKLFNVWSYINEKALNVKLWNGYCPKHEMILEIINKKEFSHLSHKNIYLIDDKDYSKEAAQIGINFIRVDQDSDLSQYNMNFAC